MSAVLNLSFSYFCAMLMLNAIPRTMYAADWATLLFLVCLTLVVITRSVFEKRFVDFLRLAVSDKYLKVYRDPSHLFSGFTILLFIVQVLSLAFFLQIAMASFGLASKTDWLLFIRIFTLLGSFILIRFLIDKIIGASFNIDDFVEQFNLQKVSYRTYIGLMLLPLNIILYYSDGIHQTLISFVIGAVILFNLFAYLISLKNYQNFVAGKLFYFILYLCALEIAPYYFMYYWFTKY